MKKTCTFRFEKDAPDRRTHLDAYLAKVRKMTPAQSHKWLIEIGALTPEGEVPVYPMDHVPLGPRN